jgi:uncharacterized protein (TIGR00661 family)
MAKILFGLMGDAHGHLNHALVIAQGMPNHEFVFVGGGTVHKLKDHGYNVEDLPMLGTTYYNNRVDVPKTLANAANVLLRRSSTIDRLAGFIRSYDPDLILVDHEYFTNYAARKLGRRTLSVGHQNLLTHCRYTPPRGQRINWLMTTVPARLFHAKSDLFLIISFFDLLPVNPKTTAVLPPLIRREIADLKPSDGEHALVYTTSPSFYGLIPALESFRRQFFVYGFGKQPERKNIVFKEYSRETFGLDMAACSYVICNASHNVISEALYLKKPVFTFPIAYNYEQFLNSYFLEKLGYGAFSTSAFPDPAVLRNFETGLDSFVANMQNQSFYGNEKVTRSIEGFAQIGYSRE